MGNYPSFCRTREPTQVNEWAAARGFYPPPLFTDYTSCNHWDRKASLDGIICIGYGRAGDTSFDNVELPSRGKLMMFQTKLDLRTGDGMYVQSIGGPGGSTVAWVAAEDAAGNVYAVGSTYSQSVYATSIRLTTQLTIGSCRCVRAWHVPRRAKLTLSPLDL